MEKPGFVSATHKGRNTDHFLFLFSFRYRDDDWSKDDESDSDFDNMHEHDEYSHSEIIHRCNFGSKHLINARLLTQTCLQHQPDSSTRDATPLCLNSTNVDGGQKTEEFALFQRLNLERQTDGGRQTDRNGRPTDRDQYGKTRGVL
jgi:hypothetical protein